jgi:hypothetical protein
MADFGGLGSVNAHGWTSGPATYTLTLTGLPTHTEVRYQCFLHFVDSHDNETSNVFTMNAAGGETEILRMRKSIPTRPDIDVLAAGASTSWHGNRFYSHMPWGGNVTRENNGGNGYLIVDSGWYSHALSSFSARHCSWSRPSSPSDEATVSVSR